MNCPSLPSFPASFGIQSGLFAFQWMGEGSGNGRREFVSIYLVQFDDISTINVLKKFLFFPEAEAARKTALFGEMQGKKFHKSAFPDQPL